MLELTSVGNVEEPEEDDVDEEEDEATRRTQDQQPHRTVTITTSCSNRLVNRSAR